MPIYQWTDKKSGKSIDVIRSFKEYEVPPTQEEAPDFEDPEWERNIGDNTTVVKGTGWGPGKGSWIQLFTGASLVCTLMQNWLV